MIDGDFGVPAEVPTEDPNENPNENPNEDNESSENLPAPLPILNASLEARNERKRGPGILWVDLEDENHDEVLFPTFQDVQNRVSQLNLSKVGEKNGKVFRFKCKVKTCSFKVKFNKRGEGSVIKGYVSSSSGEHNHVVNTHVDEENFDDLRGLSGLQKKYVRQAFNVGITSAGQILKHFRRERMKCNGTFVFPIDPDKTKLTNYASSLKKKVLKRVAGEEEWYTGPDLRKNHDKEP